VIADTFALCRAGGRAIEAGADADFGILESLCRACPPDEAQAWARLMALLSLDWERCRINDLEALAQLRFAH
jgi:hypothetical protein